MIIHSVEVYGLNNKKDAVFKLNFHEDMNIVTGRNGAGKTTLLKLLWYIVSGNIEYALRETPFSKVELVTSEYTILIVARGHDIDHVLITFSNGQALRFEVQDDDEFPGGSPTQDANEHIAEIGSSIFFPTFRRIEGGFSLPTARARFPHNPNFGNGRSRSNLEEAMSELSRKLTMQKHTFVSAISTLDIVDLLMRQYTDMSERSNQAQQKTSSEIIERIRAYKQRTTFEIDANKLIDEIQVLIEGLDKKRIEILAPLEAVTSLAGQLFKHNGIVLNSRLSFGDAANAVNSGMLSAGEKQMLSFICYNAFFDNSIVFIDEPELSLHIDWQRQLFPILQNQGTKNQFIIATHSPFIYSKYPEKEIALSDDKGE